MSSSRLICKKRHKSTTLFSAYTQRSQPNPNSLFSFQTLLKRGAGVHKVCGKGCLNNVWRKNPTKFGLQTYKHRRGSDKCRVIKKGCLAPPKRMLFFLEKFQTAFDPRINISQPCQARQISSPEHDMYNHT